jgi:Tfp pilus assembly protein PilW
MNRWGRKAVKDLDEGMSIVEVVVASAISLLLMLVVSGLFINGLQANASSLDRDGATAQAQTLALSLQTSIRDADITSVTVASGQVTARVSVNGSWVCRTWTLASGQLTYKASKTATPAVLASGVAGTLDRTGRAFATISGSAGSVEYSLGVTRGAATAAAAGTVTAQGKAGDSGGETC